MLVVGGSAMAEEPIGKRLIDLMQSLATAGSSSREVSVEVCPMVSSDSLGALEAAHSTGLKVETGTVTGMGGIEDGSQSWLLTRYRWFQWSQTLWIVISPSGGCFARLDFRAGLVS
jgi:hypothetical protein